MPLDEFELASTEKLALRRLVEVRAGAIEKLLGLLSFDLGDASPVADRHSELIVSGRGRKGGYMLARPSKKITVGEIVRCLDTPYEPSDKPDDHALETVLEGVQTAIWKVLDRTKLDKLVKKPARRSSK